jgi:hypothetical protein
MAFCGHWKRSSSSLEQFVFYSSTRHVPPSQYWIGERSAAAVIALVGKASSGCKETAGWTEQEEKPS